MYNAGIRTVSDLAQTKSVEPIVGAWRKGSEFRAGDCDSHEDYLQLLAKKAVAEARLVCAKEGREVPTLSQELKSEPDFEEYVKDSDASDLSSGSEEELSPMSGDKENLSRTANSLSGAISTGTTSREEENKAAEVGKEACEDCGTDELTQQLLFFDWSQI